MESRKICLRLVHSRVLDTTTLDSRYCILHNKWAIGSGAIGLLLYAGGTDGSTQEELYYMIIRWYVLCSTYYVRTSLHTTTHTASSVHVRSDQVRRIDDINQSTRPRSDVVSHHDRLPCRANHHLIHRGESTVQTKQVCWSTEDRRRMCLCHSNTLVAEWSLIWFDLIVDGSLAVCCVAVAVAGCVCVCICGNVVDRKHGSWLALMMSMWIWINHG